MSSKTIVFLLNLGAAAAAGFPPAPGSGGSACTLDAHCGFPAADCQQKREKCASLSGSCVKGHCVCATEGFTCANCEGQATLVRDPNDITKFIYTSQMPYLNGTRGTFDSCAEPRGGSVCKADTDCGSQNAGLCIGGTCVCQRAFVCSDCSLTQNDLQEGLSCAMGRNGGAPCKSGSDCSEAAGNGMCLPAPYSECKCRAGYTCGDCSGKITDVVAGKTKCPAMKPARAKNTIAQGNACNVTDVPWLAAYQSCKCEHQYPCELTFPEVHCTKDASSKCRAAVAGWAKAYRSCSNAHDASCYESDANYKASQDSDKSCNGNSLILI